jgi:hypothetical protein
MGGGESWFLLRGNARVSNWDILLSPYDALMLPHLGRFWEQLVLSTLSADPKFPRNGFHCPLPQATAAVRSDLNQAAF